MEAKLMSLSGISPRCKHYLTLDHKLSNSGETELSQKILTGLLCMQ